MPDMKLNLVRIVGIILVLVLIIAGGGAFLVFNKAKQDQNGNTTTSSQTDNNSSIDSKDELEKSGDGNFEPANTPANLEIPKNLPPEVNIKKLEPTSDNVGEATFVAVNNEGVLSVAIEASLNNPGSGKSYFAWLAGNNQGGGTFKLGKLELANNRYIYSDNLEGDFSAYTKIIISEEINNDNNIEKIILEGQI